MSTTTLKGIDAEADLYWHHVITNRYYYVISVDRNIAPGDTKIEYSYRKAGETKWSQTYKWSYASSNVFLDGVELIDVSDIAGPKHCVPGKECGPMSRLVWVNGHVEVCEPNGPPKNYDSKFEF